MENISPNLDDEDIFLPTNILLGDLSSTFFPYEKTNKEEVAQETSVFSFWKSGPFNSTKPLSQYNRIKLPPSTLDQEQVIISPIQFGSFDPSQVKLRTEGGPIFKFPAAKLLQPKVEIIPDKVHTMSGPFQVGMPLKESRGTGVFIPRTEHIVDARKKFHNDKNAGDKNEEIGTSNSWNGKVGMKAQIWEKKNMIPKAPPIKGFPNE